MSSDITVIVPSSPIPSHPSTRIIERAINSVREQLPLAQIIKTLDGASALIPSYEEFKIALNRVGDDSGWKGLTIFFEHHVHQSGMLEEALRGIKTPLILYWESDWELLPGIPWQELSDLILSGEFNYIKLHAQPRINPYHEHLMGSRVIYQNGFPYPNYCDAVGGKAIPMILTRQWSQNPHLASTDFYRKRILPMVEGRRDFIENIVHGIVANSPWDEFKCGIYNPAEGDMMTVRHLDGRGSR